MTAYDVCTSFLFNKGFGNDLRTVAQYRRLVEPIPEGLIEPDSDLQFLSLADPRPKLLHACRLLGIQHGELGYKEGDAVPHVSSTPLPTGPYWFRHDNGCVLRGRRPDYCRDKLVGKIQAGSATEGVFAVAHHPEIVVEGEHVIDLPMTVHRFVRVHCACLGVWGGQVGLYLGRLSDIASPHCGALRLRRK